MARVPPQPQRSVRPTPENRARMISIGEREEARPFDPSDLEATVVETEPPPFVMEGNFQDVQPPENLEPAGDPNAQAAPQGQAEPVQTAPVATGPEEDIDDPRFKGKSKKDVYEAYKNLERLKGEHDAEVSAYRRLYEEKVLKPEMEQRNKVPAATVPAAAANLEDDATLLNEMLSTPSLFAKKIRDQAKQELFNDLNRAANAQTIQAKVAAAQDIMSQPEFGKWLVANVPQHIAIQGETDPATFQFILNSYKQTLAPASTAASEVPGNPAPPTPAAPAPMPANVDRRYPVGSAVGVPAASRTTSVPSFTLGQLADMQLNRPEEYARRQPEIMAWYTEQQKQKTRS